MHLCQQYELGMGVEEKDSAAFFFFFFLKSVQINSLHHIGNFPWVVYLLPDNTELLNTCAQQALLICLCIVALRCRHSLYTCALQMTRLYLVINIFHLELSASATEMRGDHLSMKDKGPEVRKIKMMKH